MAFNFPRLFYIDNTTINGGIGGDVIATDDIGGVKHQRVKVEFGADGVATDVSLTNPLPIAQSISTDANNSSSTNLLIGSSYIGLSTTTLGAMLIQVGILCNEAGTLFIEQSPDGTNWDISDSFAITANVAFNTNVTAQLSFYRVRFVRTSTAAATTIFRLQTVIVNIANPLPRTLTQLGNLKVAIQESNSSVLFKGRASTFRITGRAGTLGQKLLSIFNTGPVTLTVDKVFVDLVQTAIIAATVISPIIRMIKVTSAASGGTALAKNKIGGTSTSNAAITVLGDASADGTNSAVALAASFVSTAILSQEFAPRLITAAGYEIADRMEFFGDSMVVLAPGEGMIVNIDYTLTTQNPATNFWLAGIEWLET